MVTGPNIFVETTNGETINVGYDQEDKVHLPENKLTQLVLFDISGNW
jgi:hypothetical protein